MTSSRLWKARAGAAAVAAALTVALTALSGCGGSDDAGTGGSGSTDGKASFDGTWSGTTSTGGEIKLTVADGKITEGEIATGEQVFGPECGQVGGRNVVHDVAIENATFSWGGEGEGWPVAGTFDSATKAHGTAEFSPDLVSGELPPNCTPASATWEATRSGD
jgi:hypothetical protein